MNPADMQLVMDYLRRDPVVKAVYDAKSEEMGPGIYRFKAEIGALKYISNSISSLGGIACLQDNSILCCPARLHTYFQLV